LQIAALRAVVGELDNDRVRAGSPDKRPAEKAGIKRADEKPRSGEWHAGRDHALGKLLQQLFSKVGRARAVHQPARDFGCVARGHRSERNPTLPWTQPALTPRQPISSETPKTFCGRTKPASSNSPTATIASSHAAANAVEARIVRPRRPVSFSMRAAR